MTHTRPELGVPILAQSVLFTVLMAGFLHCRGSQQHILSHRNRASTSLLHIVNDHRLNDDNES